VKIVALVRHGRAHPEAAPSRDFDRPLDDHGRQEVRAMARRLAELDWEPEAIVASAAERTRQTAQILASVLEVPAHRVVCEARLYLAPPDQLLEVLQDLDPDLREVMLVGHNPGLSELARELARRPRLADLATAAACRITSPARVWGRAGRDGPRRVELEMPPDAAPPQG
jgi:phosphohistidine phosphatase